MTAHKSCSYCELLLSQESPGVATAQVFISHAWGYKFLDVVDALCDHFVDRPAVVIWFDLFSNNQHRAGGLPFEWWRTTFRTAIEGFKHTVVVLAPWRSPVVFTRAWCLFEIFTSVETGSRFEVAMAATDRSIFLADVRQRHGMFYDMLATINVKNSTATNPQDKRNIFDIVERSGGFHHLNGVVLNKMRSLLVSALEEAVAKVSNFNEEMGLKTALANIYSNEGRLHCAERLYKECWTKTKAAAGKGHRATLSMLSNYASGCAGRGKIRRAEVLFGRCVSMMCDTLGPSDAVTLRTTSMFADVLFRRGQSRRATTLCEWCLRCATARLGQSHEATLGVMNDVAIMYCREKKFAQAEPLFRKHFHLLERTVGADHPSTLRAMCNFAKALADVGKSDASLRLQERCLAKLRVVRGEDHPDTLMAMSEVAKLYFKRRNFFGAEYLWGECADTLRDVLGGDHLQTLEALSNYATTLVRLGEFQEALELYDEALTTATFKLGPQHHLVAKTKRLFKSDFNKPWPGPAGMERGQRRPQGSGLLISARRRRVRVSTGSKN